MPSQPEKPGRGLSHRLSERGHRPLRLRQIHAGFLRSGRRQSAKRQRKHRPGMRILFPHRFRQTGFRPPHEALQRGHLYGSVYSDPKAVCGIWRSPLRERNRRLCSFPEKASPDRCRRLFLQQARRQMRGLRGDGHRAQSSRILRRQRSALSCLPGQTFSGSCPCRPFSGSFHLGYAGSVRGRSAFPV